LQSIVTSSAQNDSGMFETNLRDERFLPFENSGVVSEWQLKLPANPSKGDPCQFDYDTISDVILHLCYTAREGGGLLRDGAVAHLKTRIDEAQAAGSVRLFSIRHEFPTEWAKFQSAQLRDPTHPDAPETAELTLNLRAEHYPFWSRGRLQEVKRVDLLAHSSKHPLPATSLDVFDKADKNDPTANKDTLAKGTALGNLLVGNLSKIALPTPTTPVDKAFRLFFPDKAMSDLWIAVTWGSV
jgi:hypothetical protein